MGRTKAILLSLIFIIISNILIFRMIDTNQKTQIDVFEKTILKEARAHFRDIINTRTWNSKYNGVYVKANNLKPNKYLKNNHIFTKDNEKLIKINPAWMTRQISEIANKRGDYYYKITSLRPKNPDNKPDNFEKKSLEYFEKNNTNEKYSFNRSKSKFNYIGALKIEKSCLNCHTSQNYKLNDYIGGIRVTLPTNDFQSFSTNLNKTTSINKTLIAIVSIFVFLITAWFINTIYNRQDEIEKISKENEELSQRYKLAIDGSNDGLWDWNIETGEVYFSKRWKEMLGFKDDELESKLDNWTNRVHPDDLKKAQEDIEKNQKGLTAHYENVHRLRHKDGSFVWILDRGQTIFNQKGEAVRMLGFHTDITEQKNLEISLNKSQEDLLKSQKMANMAFWKLNIKSMKLSFSKNIKNLFGIEENKEFTLKELFVRKIIKEDREKVTKTFTEAVKNRTPYNIVYRYQKENDETIRYINCSVDFEMKDEKVINAIGNIQDITEIQEIQNELNILRTAIEQAPITFVLTNKDGQIEYVNPAFTKTTGYTFEEAKNQNPRILKSDFTESFEYEKLWETISNGGTWNGTFKNINKEGKEFWEMAIISPIYTNNEISNYLAIKQEITKEVYLKQELQDKEELMIAQSRHAAMGEMISMIAHQWRQPIAVIAMGANNVLADIELESLDEAQTQEILNDIIHQTEYLSQTIDDFKNFFKPDKEKDYIFIEDVFNETFKVMGKMLDNNDITVIQEYKSKTQINTYSKELLQVFINIIKNAKEILVEKKEFNRLITINEYKLQNSIVIEICDNGGGIEEKNIEFIFDPYFTTKEELGTGLGLYMTKTIVEKHLGGNISAFNKKDGACFKIKLPIKDN